MFGKKSNIGKKGNITGYLIFGLFFSFISLMYIFISVFSYIAFNDYVFVPMQDLSEELQQEGILTQTMGDRTQQIGQAYQDFNFHFDDLWMIAYIIFIATSLTAAYKAKQQNYFSFLTTIIYGVMIFLFLLTFEVYSAHS